MTLYNSYALYACIPIAAVFAICTAIVARMMATAKKAPHSRKDW